MRLFSKNPNGEALTVVMMVLVMLATVSATLMSLGYNQRRLRKSVGAAGQIVAFYHARAGIVDAIYRLRNSVGPGREANYFNAGQPGYGGANYSKTIDGVPFKVTIGAIDANGLRKITAADNP